MASIETTDCRALTVITTPGRATAPLTPRACAYPDAVFEAQRLGQPGQKRGLRGGPPLLEAARGAYLSAEFAGQGDRRPTPGLLAVREI